MTPPSPSDRSRCRRPVAPRAPRSPGSPGWPARTFTADLLPGGLTNRNYRVTAANGRRLVVRLSSPQSALLDDRSRCRARQRGGRGVDRRRAGSVGLRPGPGRAGDRMDRGPRPSPPPISTTTRRSPGSAATCRRLHAGPRFATDFDMFDGAAALSRSRDGARLPAARGLPRLHADRGQPMRDGPRRCAPGADRALPQRSARGQHHGQRRAACGSSTTSTPATAIRASSSATCAARPTSAPTGSTELVAAYYGSATHRQGGAGPIARL